MRFMENDHKMATHAKKIIAKEYARNDQKWLNIELITKYCSLSKIQESFLLNPKIMKTSETVLHLRIASMIRFEEFYARAVGEW